MTYLHDPRPRATRAPSETHGRALSRRGPAATPARGAHDDAELPATAGDGLKTARTRHPLCSDCALAFGRHLHLHLPPEPAEVSRVRWAVRGALSSWGCPSGALDDGLLLISELAGNAVKHAPGAWIAVDVMEIGDHLLVEVTDASPLNPVVRQAGSEDEQGRGMCLVQAIASAWGARRDRHNRKTTWCTLALNGRGDAPQAY